MPTFLNKVSYLLAKNVCIKAKANIFKQVLSPIKFHAVKLHFVSLPPVKFFFIELV